MKSILNEIFDKIYCINLDRRPDRWQECVEEFNKHNLDVERVSAVDGNPDNYPHRIGHPHKFKVGMIGCALSHMKCVKQANEAGYRKILIVEDDIKFVDDLNQKFEEYYLEVPKNWQLLYAGGNHLGAHNVRHVSPHCIRILNTYTTHFIGMDASMYPLMLNRIPANINNPIDVIYAEWQRHVEAFCMIPHLAWQRESFSDIDGMMANYDAIIKDFKINY